MTIARPSLGRCGALAVVLLGLAGCGAEGRATSEQAATVAASPATAPATSLVTAPPLVLGRDGIGAAAFGDPADDAIAAVTAVLGDPDEDSGWVEPLSIGTCAGTRARYVSWGGLYLHFSDESAVATGQPHLFAYSYGHVSDLEVIPEGLATPEGVGLGTGVEYLRAAYPEVVVEPGEEGMFPPSFRVDEALSGRLTGAADDDLVTVIIGGDPCGVGM